MITGVTTPQATAYLAQQGDRVEISFVGEDGEDVAVVRVFASTAGNPSPAQEIPIESGFTLGPGVGSGTAEWNTTGIAEGSYNIFAEIDDRTYDAATGLGNLPVRGTAPRPLIISAVGTAPENSPPNVQIELPSTDAGLTNQDILTIRCLVRDANSDKDTLTVTYYFDKDLDTSNDGADPPIVLGSDTVPSGSVAPNTFLRLQTDITIDLNKTPIRRETDEGGRPLPYYVRVRVSDGKGGVVDRYAPGAVRILAAASDVVDLLQVGSTTSGATWQGYFGDPYSPAYGGRAGSAFAPVGDMDADGLDDFVIVSERASPHGQYGVGEAHLIYGRRREADPNSPTFQYAQGRYGGVISLNSVGTFVDPPYYTIFNVRGSTIFQDNILGGNSLGLTSVVGLPNITDLGSTDPNRDTTPELMLGAPFDDRAFDQEDTDPCDKCSFSDQEATPLTCYANLQFHSGDNALSADADGIGNMAANAWAPFNPSVAPGGIPENVDLGLGTSRIYQITAFTVCLKGKRPEGPSAGAKFKVRIQIENAKGPWLEQDVDPINPQGDPPTGGGDFDGCDLNADSYTATARFNFNINSAQNFPVSEGQVLPPSVYDGKFYVFVKIAPIAPDTLAGGVNFDTVEVRVSAITADPEQHPIRYTYADTFPGRYSDTTGCADEDPAPVDPLSLGEVSPACPPMNRSQGPTMSDPRTTLPDGLLCQNIAGLLGAPNGATNDDLTQSAYESGIAYICGGNDLVLPLDEQGLYTSGKGFEAAGTSQFGQPRYLRQGGLGMRGARFRGAWLNPYGFYDPTSLFGYSLDVTPQLDAWGARWGDILISAPAAGQYDWTLYGPGSQGINTLATTYTAPATKKQVFVDLGVQFNTVLDAELWIYGTAFNIPRLRLSLADDQGNTITGTRREMLFWGGAGLPQATNEDPSLEYEEFFPDPFAIPPSIVYTVDFTSGVSMPLPRAALPYLKSGVATLTLEIIGDCVVTGSQVNIDEAYFFVDGLLANAGSVHVLEGWDYTSNAAVEALCGGETDGDKESGEERPMSWPSTKCNTDLKPPTRTYCDPDEMTFFVGEAGGDGLGWAHYAGYVNQDGHPDIVFGAPLSDNNPFVPDLANCPPVEQNTMQDNGKVYLLYGHPTFSGGYPCEPVSGRFEIRGSHDDDQFGRVQGRAGDVNGDHYDDIFFAAEGYDALGPVNGISMPNIGVDAGFVGILFGGPSLTGEVAVHAERVGTGNYLGCKFIGGSAGARLGGGTPSQYLLPSSISGALPVIERGQYGVAGAGDFNGDGFDDFLITAPGQTWPGARIVFTGAVLDGSTVTINGTVFEFDTNGVTSPGRVAVHLTSSTAYAAQSSLLSVLTQSADTVNIAALKSQRDFPDPQPDYPTISFLGRRATGLSVSATGVNIQIAPFTRQGTAYLIFGSDLLLRNKTFILPDDLNRKVGGQRILKGIVFVSAYEQGSLDEAPIEVVSAVGDVDGDGFGDIILGAPAADYVNVLSPTQRRQDSGEAYLIYGNKFGLNASTTP